MYEMRCILVITLMEWAEKAVIRGHGKTYWYTEQIIYKKIRG